MIAQNIFTLDLGELNLKTVAELTNKQANSLLLSSCHYFYTSIGWTSIQTDFICVKKLTDLPIEKPNNSINNVKGSYRCYYSLGYSANQTSFNLIIDNDTTVGNLIWLLSKKYQKDCKIALKNHKYTHEFKYYNLTSIRIDIETKIIVFNVNVYKN